jgi:hypothetical protein
MEHEAIGLIPSFLKEFWYIGVVFLIFSVLFRMFIPTFNSSIEIKQISTKQYIKKYSLFIIILNKNIYICTRNVSRNNPNGFDYTHQKSRNKAIQRFHLIESQTIN